MPDISVDAPVRHAWLSSVQSDGGPPATGAAFVAVLTDIEETEALPDVEKWGVDADDTVPDVPEVTENLEERDNPLLQGDAEDFSSEEPPLDVATGGFAPNTPDLREDLESEDENIWCLPQGDMLSERNLRVSFPQVLMDRKAISTTPDTGLNVPRDQMQMSASMIQEVGGDGKIEAVLSEEPIRREIGPASAGALVFDRPMKWGEAAPVERDGTGKHRSDQSEPWRFLRTGQMPIDIGEETSRFSQSNLAPEPMKGAVSQASYSAFLQSKTLAGERKIPESEGVMQVLEGDFPPITDRTVVTARDPGGAVRAFGAAFPLDSQQGIAVIRQVSEAIRLTPGGAIDVALSPEELGSIKLRLIGHEGQMNVVVQAERPETLDLMRRHIESLSQEFRAIGYRDVAFSFQSGGGGEHPPPDQERGIVWAHEDMPASDSAERQAGLMLRSGLDIRI